MNDNAKKAQNQGQEHTLGGPCCGPVQWDMPRAMTQCFTGCRYFLLFAAIVGIVVVILGYYLAPGVLRACWVIAAAMMGAMVLFGVLAMQRMAAGNGSTRCCGPRPGRDL